MDPSSILVFQEDPSGAQRSGLPGNVPIVGTYLSEDTSWDAEPGLTAIPGADFQLKCLTALFEETNCNY